jgi:hypothetical protein
MGRPLLSDRDSGSGADLRYLRYPGQGAPLTVSSLGAGGHAVRCLCSVLEVWGGGLMWVLGLQAVQGSGRILGALARTGQDSLTARRL